MGGGALGVCAYKVFLLLMNVLYFRSRTGRCCTIMTSIYVLESVQNNILSRDAFTIRNAGFVARKKENKSSYAISWASDIYIFFMVNPFFSLINLKKYKGVVGPCSKEVEYDNLLGGGKNVISEIC